MCKEEINIVIILTHNTKIPSFDWPRFWLLSIWAGTEYWRIQKHRAQTKNEHDVLEQGGDYPFGETEPQLLTDIRIESPDGPVRSR